MRKKRKYSSKRIPRKEKLPLLEKKVKRVWNLAKRWESHKKRK